MDQTLFHLINEQWTNPVSDLFMAAISNVSLNVLSRSIIGDQLLSTWEMTGTHDGPFYSYAPTGAQIKLSGTTVQTRGRDGKITSETLYYDAADMQRQLSGG